MDSMQKELDMWKDENKEHQIALRREQRYILMYVYVAISCSYTLDDVLTFLIFLFLSEILLIYF